MHKIVLKVAVELSATVLLGARIASNASFIETFKGSLISEFFRFGQIQKKVTNPPKDKMPREVIFNVLKKFLGYFDKYHPMKSCV